MNPNGEIFRVSTFCSPSLRRRLRSSLESGISMTEEVAVWATNGFRKDRFSFLLPLRSTKQTMPWLHVADDNCLRRTFSGNCGENVEKGMRTKVNESGVQGYVDGCGWISWIVRTGKEVIPWFAGGDSQTVERWELLSIQWSWAYRMLISFKLAARACSLGFHGDQAAGSGCVGYSIFPAAPLLISAIWSLGLLLYTSRFLQGRKEYLCDEDQVEVGSKPFRSVPTLLGSRSGSSTATSTVEDGSWFTQSSALKFGEDW